MKYTDPLIVSFIGYIVIGALTWVVISLYLCRSFREQIISHMPSSTSVVSTAPTKTDNQWKKFIWINNVAAYVTFPSFHIKRGELNPDEIQNLPVPLRRRLIALRWGIVSLVSSVAILLVRLTG